MYKNATTYPVLAIDYVADRIETIKIYPKFTITQIVREGTRLLIDDRDLDGASRLFVLSRHYPGPKSL